MYESPRRYDAYCRNHSQLKQYMALPGANEYLSCNNNKPLENMRSMSVLYE